MGNQELGPAGRFPEQQRQQAARCRQWRSVVPRAAFELRAPFKASVMPRPLLALLLIEAAQE